MQSIRAGGRNIVMVTVAVSLVSWGLISGPVAAQIPGNLSYDTTQPIDVSADRLEVREDGRTAIFTGNVEAIQGDLQLHATEIRVYYRPDDGDGLIARIDANGDVTIETPEEKAHGDWAIYDVDQKILTLGGAVEIERGGNTIEGQRLVLDLETGQTRIDAGRGGEGGRVRGVFSPSSGDE